MGLFSFKKKKQLIPPSQPAGMPVPEPAEQKEEIDFDKMMAEIPEAPPDINSTDTSFFHEQGAPSTPRPPFQAKPGEKPSFGNASQPVQASQSTMQSQPSPSESPAPLVIPGFELPDFEDEEMRRLEEAKIEEAKPEEVKAVEKKPEEKPEPPEPVSWAEEPKPATYPEPAKPAAEIKDKFMDISTYLTAKEDFEAIMRAAAKTGDMIEQHAIISKAKGDKYQILAENLNIIQDKLILIDTKLFENND